MEQGSYMLIEKGMTIHGSDGDIGTVAEVIADQGADIFRGLVLTHGLLIHKRAFIPAENVTGVSGRTVQVNLTKAEAENLPPPTASTSETEATHI
jgi:uncharacterized protein YrrD